MLWLLLQTPKATVGVSVFVFLSLDSVMNFRRSSKVTLLRRLTLAPRELVAVAADKTALLAKSGIRRPKPLEAMASAVPYPFYLRSMSQ